MKLTDLSPLQRDALYSHMTAYLGEQAVGIFSGDFTDTGNGNIFSLGVQNGLLNDKLAPTAYLIIKDAGFLFGFTGAAAGYSYADYFPQMVPADPWGIADISQLPFPNLPSKQLDEATWIYVYVSSADATFADNIWTAFCGIPAVSASLGRKPKSWAELRDIVKGDVPLDDPQSTHGGLFYTGKFNVLPFPDLAVPGISEIWHIASAGIDAKGGIYYAGIIPRVKLQVQLISLDDPFGPNAPIQRLNLDAEVSSQLVASAVAALPAATSGEAADPSAGTGQDRYIGAAGQIRFRKTGTEIDLAGAWPLDGDLILIKASCSITELDSYFNLQSVIPGLQPPENLSTAIAFAVSKSNKSLEKIDFELQVTDWPLVKNIMTIRSADFKFGIHQPGAINAIVASFSAAAVLGSGDDGILLACSGSYPSGNFSLALDPGTPIYLKKLLKVFSSADIGIADDLAITELSGQYNSGTKYFALRLSVAGTSPLSAGDLSFSLSQLSVSVSGAGPYIFRLNAAFTYALTKSSGEPLQFSGSAEYNEGWIFNLRYSGTISLADIGKEFGFGDVPEQLNDFSFTELAFGLNAPASQKMFSGACNIKLFGADVDLSLLVNQNPAGVSFSGQFELAVNGSQASFGVDFLKNTDGSYEALLQLLFKVAGITFSLRAGSKSSGLGDQKIAEKSFEGGAAGLNIHIVELLDDLLRLDLPNYKAMVPDGFLPDITLQEIYVAYDGGAGLTNLVAVATVSGNTINLFYQNRASSPSPDTKGAVPAGTVFGINGDFKKLGDLPMVGDEMKDVSLQGVGFIYSSVAGKVSIPVLSPPDAFGSRKITLTDTPGQLDQGFNLAGQIRLSKDGTTIPLALPVSSKPVSNNNIPTANPATASPGNNTVSNNAAAPAAAQTPGVKWINLNKKIGPVEVTKIGFAYKDQRLSLLLTGSVALAGFSLSVEGLEVSFLPAKLISGEIDALDPRFSLAGLGLAFEKAPLKISAMFLRAEPGAGETLAFYGAAQLSTSKLSISGVGAYARLTDGSSSFFIYAMYNGPVGGPAFFFVTGIAAGFGYNRTIRVPKLAEVSRFPLVAMALSGDNAPLQQVLGQLTTVPPWIPTSPGDYWLAVGIKFTSFKIIESFVLLAVQFGTKLEFTILGLSLLKWPSVGVAIAYVELAVLARFSPESDVIQVTAMLTPNSYVLDPNCRLSGGFAFYAWVAGEHEGDFVITLGGYHPKYQPPAHYPKVDRLALNWKFSNALSIHGDMYYALTPREIMAGGRWEVKYDLSFLSASVLVWADMMMSWAPFHYTVDAGVNVRIEANIKILFVNIHFSVQIACELHIWGPPFSGEMYVDWTIFSFTIPFGAPEKVTPPPLLWEDFNRSFVPTNKRSAQQPLDLRFVGGVVGEDRDNDGNVITTYVDPYSLVLGVDSFFPVSTLYPAATGETALHDDTSMIVAGSDSPMRLAGRNTQFGIKPMAISQANVTLRAWVESGGSEQDLTFRALPAAKGVTSALWASENETAAVLKNVLSGLELHTTGARDDASILSIPLDEDYYTHKIREEQIGYLTGRDAEGQKTAKIIADTLTSSVAASGITPTAGMLSALGFDVYVPEAVTYDELKLDTPLYLASIGQKIPAIPHT